mmetsp:Transcript_122792/g.393331  ORF Transcript_122792/g.393331 Transcript_122792/m.393331 type:complete len:241 (-) Transcript_122792:866-1588(-)
MISISPVRSWPLAQAACSGVRLPGPSSATEGSALARKSSAITSSEPWPAASQSAPAHAEAVAKELAMSRRIRAGWPQEAALRKATATSFSSCRASGTTRAASNSRASSSPSGASPPGFGTSALRAKLCRSSPRPSLVSRPRIVTCSGNTSCQNACSRNRNRPGPRGAPLDKSLTSRGWAAGAATVSSVFCLLAAAAAAAMAAALLAPSLATMLAPVVAVAAAGRFVPDWPLLPASHSNWA